MEPWPMDLRGRIPEDTLLAWVREAIENLDKDRPELKESLHPATTDRAKLLLSVIILASTAHILRSEDIVRACRSEKVFAGLCGKEAPFRDELEQFRRKNRLILERALAAVLLRAVKELYPAPERPPAGVESLAKARAIDLLDTIRNMDTWDE